jgi:hypothetical protein
MTKRNSEAAAVRIFDLIVSYGLTRDLEWDPTSLI